MSLAQAKDFIQKLDTRLGRKAVIYGGNLLKTALGGTHDAFLGQHRLWWAQYNITANIPPTWSQFWLWQFTDGHHGPPPHAVDGIGPCDIDNFEGTAAAVASAMGSVAPAAASPQARTVHAGSLTVPGPGSPMRGPDYAEPVIVDFCASGPPRQR